MEQIPDVDLDELKAAIHSLSNNKSADEDGVVVELLKVAPDEFLTLLLEQYNSVLANFEPDPKWLEILFQMLPKAGNLQSPQNWRPIAILDLFYKVFAKIIASRIHPILESHQSDDSFGFRPGKRIDDVFCILEDLTAKANEWSLPLWIVSLDLSKAFDRVDHEALFAALADHGIPKNMILLIRRLYSNQIGRVNESKEFPIERGVKQGDILSPMLFNAIMEVLVHRWKQRVIDGGWLVDVNLPRLQATRFADDVILYARSRDEVQEMLSLFQIELARMGLQLNMKKTKILTNDTSRVDHDSISFVNIGDDFIEILRSSDCHRVLGKDVNLTQNRAQIEIAHRLRLAWASFHKHRKALTNRGVSLRLRLRLFHSVVSPVALFGLSCISLTDGLLRKIDVVQRRMLRCIVGWTRIPDEDWEITMRRMRDKVNRATKLISLWPWSYYIGDRQWLFAQRIANSDAGIWPRAICSWEPLHLANEWAERPFRIQGRPARKWDDELREHCSGAFATRDWLHAASSNAWSDRRHVFACIQLIRAGTRLPQW